MVSSAFEIPEELQMLQRLVRRFVSDELIPIEMDVPESGPEGVAEEHVSKRLREIGLWAFNVPVEYGGGGVGALGEVLFWEEVSRAAFIYIPGFYVPPVLYAATPEQKEKYLLPVIRGQKRTCFALTEPTGGSDPGGNTQTVARLEDDNWVLNGRKVFITGGERADLVIVFAITDKSKRQHGGMTAFVVEAGVKGFTVVRTIPTMGGVAPAELDFQDCVVADSQRIGEVGMGFVLAQQLLGAARFAIGARAVGMADRLLEMALSYVEFRETFGKRLAERQAIQWMLADSAIDMHACRWMTYRAASRLDAGQDTRFESSLIKVHASEMMFRVADRVMQIHGGWGYSKDFPIERFFRLARMFPIVEGPNEVHRWALARSLLNGGIGVLRAVP